MTETLVFLLGIALVVVNHRREIWKHRARLRAAEIQNLKTLYALERDANEKLLKQIPNSLIYKRTSNEWPDQLDG